MERFYILRKALAPEVDLMHHVVGLNSPAYFFQRAHDVLQGLPPKSRILDMHLAATEGIDSCYHQFFLKYGTMMEDETGWDHLAATEIVSTEIVRHCLRPPSVFYELVWRRWSMWPYKLFKLLQSPDCASALRAEARAFPCMLDTFSASFLQQYSSPEEMQSQSALLTLHLLALSAVHNTYSVEQMHSSNARKTRQRAHTHCMKVEDLAMWLQSSSSPSWWQPSHQDRVSLKTSSGKPPLHLSVELNNTHNKSQQVMIF